MADDTRMVTLLVMDDGEARVRVPRRVLGQSLLLSAMLTSPGGGSEQEEPELPVSSISQETLLKVVEFLLWHVDEPFAEIEKPLQSNNMREIMSEWDANYVDPLDTQALLLLATAASSLNIPTLVDLAAAVLASKIKGKTPEEIRQTFGIVNDFTEEEEAQVRAENAWVME